MGTMKKPVFLELRLNIKKNGIPSSEHIELETVAEHNHRDTDQANRMWKWISREKLWQTPMRKSFSMD